MNLCDLSLTQPEADLACDEALLDLCEAGGPGPVLRFWEPARYFVVLGYANHAAVEANLPFCRANGIPVLRRCTGGGAVLQGPGVLNYTLILPKNLSSGMVRTRSTASLTSPGMNGTRWNASLPSPCHSIAATNAFVLERHCAALTPLLCPAVHPNRSFPRGFLAHEHKAASPFNSFNSFNPFNSSASSPVQRQGQTDLTLGGLKFSGNAQRRHRRCLIFHGSFLLNLDFDLLGKALPLPSRQPAYRANRSHADFLMNLKLPAETLKLSLRQAWNANQPLPQIPHDQIALLARQKYSRDEWNFKF